MAKHRLAYFIISSSAMVCSNLGLYPCQFDWTLNLQNSESQKKFLQTMLDQEHWDFFF